MVIDGHVQLGATTARAINEPECRARDGASRSNFVSAVPVRHRACLLLCFGLGRCAGWRRQAVGLAAFRDVVAEPPALPCV